MSGKYGAKRATIVGPLKHRQRDKRSRSGRQTRSRQESVLTNDINMEDGPRGEHPWGMRRQQGEVRRRQPPRQQESVLGKDPQKSVTHAPSVDDRKQYQQGESRRRWQKGSFQWSTLPHRNTHQLGLERAAGSLRRVGRTISRFPPAPP